MGKYLGRRSRKVCYPDGNINGSPLKAYFVNCCIPYTRNGSKQRADAQQIFTDLKKKQRRILTNARQNVNIRDEERCQFTINLLLVSGGCIITPVCIFRPKTSICRSLFS